MSESGNVAVTMAVDTKKYGIRIHKALFRQLGEPTKGRRRVRVGLRLLAELLRKRRVFSVEDKDIASALLYGSLEFYVWKSFIKRHAYAESAHRCQIGQLPVI